MKFTDDITSFLSGSRFSSGLRIKIASPEGRIKMRIEYLEALARNRKVIHLGCADHLPLIKQKISKNTWLHKRLLQITKKCVGIDIDQTAISFLKDDLRIPDVYCLDITKDEIPSELRSQKWDYIILGELIEHLNDPIHFLSKIKEKFGGNVDKIVITAPNALRIENFLHVFKGKEANNSDHRYWFTPYTLAKNLNEAGISVEVFDFCEGWRLGLDFIFRKILIRLFPAFRTSIIMVGKLTN